MIALICNKPCWIKKISRRKIAFLSNLITETCNLELYGTRYVESDVY